MGKPIVNMVLGLEKKDGRARKHESGERDYIIS